MQKVILVTSLFVSSLLADTSLGTKISVGAAQEEIIEGGKHYVNTPQPTQQLQTRVSPQNIQQSFRKDHHRYDKRYSNFNYDRDGYYNDEGLYFGYYDTTGYFYNNIFFAYNSSYRYNDRRYRRGFFRRGHYHRRPYVHHRFNNWNRIHCYREPNVIVRGRYYDRRYYPRNSRSNVVHNHYYNTPSRHNQRNHVREHYPSQRTPSRMHVTRMGNNHADTRSNGNNSRNYNNRNPTQNTRNYGNHHRNSMHQANRPRGNYSRMHTPNSGHNHKSGRHMGISK